MSKKVLICGLGRMGTIHEKYLNLLNIDYMWYDTASYKSNDDKRLMNLSDIVSNRLTHIIISTPEGTHFKLYSEIKKTGYEGKFLIEKPVIIDFKNKQVFDDENVYPGMVERFNPVIAELKNRIDIEKLISIDFVRCSVKSHSIQRVDSFTDVGIHDIDLYFYLMNASSTISDYQIQKYSNTFSLAVSGDNGHIARFLWSNETFSKERKVIVRQNNCTYEADLIDETLKKYTKATNKNDYGVLCQNLYIEKSSSIRNQLENFLSNSSKNINAEASHSFYIKIKEHNNEKLSI